MLIIHVYCLKTQSFPKLKKGVNSSVNSMTNLANNETFDQSEHDTRIWYHGTAASKACLQALPLFPPPQSTTQLTSLFQIFFCRTPFPHCEARSHPLYTKEKSFSLFDTLYTSYHKQTHQRTKNHGHQIHRASNVCRFLLGEVKSVSVIHIYEFAAKREKVNVTRKQSIILLKAT